MLKSKSNSNEYRITIPAVAIFLFLFIVHNSFGQWNGFTDKSSELNTSSYTFSNTVPPGAGTDNTNYYDGDFGDADGDGLMDRGINSRYALLWNTGEGILIPAKDLLDFFGVERDGMQWADVDNDGDLDNFTAGNGNNESCWLQINEKGNFDDTRNLGGKGYRIMSTDIENDGDVDILITNNNGAGGDDNRTRLYINDGNANFSSDPLAAAENRGISTAALTDELKYGDMVNGDIDGDGDFDIIIKSYTSIFHVYVNDGTGNYTLDKTRFPATANRVTLRSMYQAMNLGDIDDDGDLDFVTTVGHNDNPLETTNLVYINDGTGNFTDESASRMPTIPPNPVLPSGAGKLVDIDYDGDLDFISMHKVANGTGNDPGIIRIYLNDGSGFFTEDTNHSHSWTTPDEGQIYDMDVSDVDGDGVYDVWVGPGGGDVQLLINTYNPSIKPNIPRNVQVESTSGSGIAISWQAPTYADVVRKYKVYRSTGPEMARGDRKLIKYIAKSRHTDESFVAPITRHTSTSYLNDPDVTLHGGQDKIEFIDRTAIPGITYYYSVTHVGTENNESDFSDEVSATIAGPTGSDNTDPYLEVIHPNHNDWTTNPRIVIEFGDGNSGIDLNSLWVSCDKDMGDVAGGDPGARAANTNVADLFGRLDNGTYLYPVLPVRTLPQGDVTFTFRISDNAGNQTEKQVTYNVRGNANTPPVAAFSTDVNSGPAPLTVTFDASASHDNGNEVIEWRWYWMDNRGGERGRIIQHTFEEDGTYPVKLLVRDKDGAYSEISHTITVGDVGGLLAHWKLDGNGTDEQGNNDLSNNGASFVSGVDGQSAEMAPNDYFAIQNFNYNSSGHREVTVSAWIKTTNGGDQVIVSYDRNEYWRLEINGNGGGTGQIGWDVKTNSGQLDFGSNTRVDDGNWHHVVGVYDNGTAKIYIDGVEDVSTTSGSTFGTGISRYGFVGVGSEASNFDGNQGPANFFDGTIDDVRLYDRALSSSEIQDLYDAFISSGPTQYRVENKGRDWWLQSSGSNSDVFTTDQSTTGDYTKWEVEDIDGTWFYLNSVGKSGYRLQDNNGTPTMVTSNDHNGTWVQWKMVDTGDGYFRIENNNSGDWLQAAGDKSETFMTGTSSTGPWTKWKFVSTSGREGSGEAVRNEVDEQKSGLRLYPNPSTGHVTLTNIPANASVKVLSISGQKVADYGRVEKRELNIEGLKKGMYLIRINTVNGNETLKLMLQ